VVGDEETDRDTIVFHFDVECKNEKTLNKFGKEEYVNESAVSGQLTWLPQGEQLETFPGKLSFCIFSFHFNRILNRSYDMSRKCETST